MRLLTTIIGLALGMALSSIAAAMPSAEYLPDNADLDTNIPPPESILGFEPGDWRIHHPALVQYLTTLAEKSDRVSIKVTGHTYEQRPLLQLIISSEENQANLESLREAHLQGTQSGDPDAPLVVWLGYSVHGDEASGSNAAPIVAWYLAASQSGHIKELLENTIIILDPSLNPDGFDRFASWSNSNHSVTAVADRSGRIHNQDWPPGRTNHYLFDLNRDWLPLVHPESRARITEFHRWLPHVLTDHHETGTDGFFFQPGVPTRQHPLTTAENLEMTRALAEYHAKTLGEAGVMYFSEDTYDDFYYGKGSTYPDINGSIGILFEQPNVRGPVIDRDSGTLTFSDAIHNQVHTSLSTLQGAHALQSELKKYQAGFFATTKRRADNAGFQAWVIGDGGDSARALELMDIFKRHQVSYEILGNEISADGKIFKPGHAWVIPVNQRQFGLAQAMLETRVEFEDNTFYDVSAWSLPMAYNLPYTRLPRLPKTSGSNQLPVLTSPNPDAATWIIAWNQLRSPAVLQDLLEAGVRVRVASKPFSMTTTDGQRRYSEGSLVILSGIQDKDKSDTMLKILQKATDDGVSVQPYKTQQTVSGPGLGTPHFKIIDPVKPILVVGNDVRSYDAGEAWHQLDQRLGVPPVMVELNRLEKIDLHDYTHLLLVDGKYKAINETLKQKITTWIDDGGVLVAIQGAATWTESLCFGDDDCEKAESEETTTDAADVMAYADFADQQAQLIIGGAIVGARVDPTHPIAFGFNNDMPIFRRGNTLLKASENRFTTPVRYTDKPLISGYIGTERLAEMSSQPAVIAERHGKGVVIRFANNPLFRGFWRGTARLWVNALYFGPMINHTELPQ